MALSEGIGEKVKNLLTVSSLFWVTGVLWKPNIHSSNTFLLLRAL